MYLLYDLALLIAACYLVPYYLLRGLLRGKVRQGLRERFGRYPAGKLEPLRGRPVIWLHAVSVGEARAAIPLVKALRREYPGHALIMTTVTETGRTVANEIAELDLHLFLPFDFSWVVRSVLDRLRPELIVIVETELWPNFVRLAAARRIPVVLANGRISDRSFPRYLLARGLLRRVFAGFSRFCMQSALDAERILAIGAPPGRVEVTGNLKFDMAPASSGTAEASRLRARFKLPADALVWVAGSTHAGEEEVIADLYRQLVREGHPLVLALVPRHPERCRGVADLLAGRGIVLLRRSRLRSDSPVLKPGEVLLVDRIGELMELYAASDIVFVGGSLVATGGHNILEPALFRKPVLFGPHMHNFKDIARLLVAAGGGVQVADGDDLGRQLRRLLADPAARQELGEAEGTLFAANAGATARTLTAIRELVAR